MSTRATKENHLASSLDGLSPEPLWDDPLTASLAVVDGTPPLKEGFSGLRNPFVTGRENDGTGLYYYRARYYSPTLQRFITEDPIGLLGGDVNFYAYVRNNPINGIDSLGLASGDFWDVRTYLPDLEGARRIAEEVRDKARETNLPGAHNGPQDAWRHAEWNRRMVEEIGRGTALIASYGHELGEIFDQPFAELLMDLHNNREGRRIANTGKTSWDLLNEGRLRTINPPNTGCPTSGRKDPGQFSYCGGSYY